MIGPTGQAAVTKKVMAPIMNTLEASSAQDNSMMMPRPAALRATH